MKDSEMNWKKNVFSNCIWVIYSMITAVIVFFMARVIGVQTGVRAEIYAPAAVGVVIVCYALAALLKGAALAEIGERAKVLFAILEALLVIGLTIAGIYLCVIRVLPDAIRGGRYFEFAKVTADGSIPVMVHGAVYFYLYFLHAVCLFFGNNIIACAYAQIAVHALTGLVLYGAVRKLSGAFPALTLLGFFTCTNYMVRETLILQPAHLYLLVFAVALFAMACCLKNPRGNLFGYFFAGAMAALATYLDITGIVLLVFLCSVFGIAGNEEEVYEEERRVHPKGVIYFVCLIAYVGVFAGLIGLDAAFTGNSTFGVMSAWLQLFLPGQGRIPVDVFSQYGMIVLIVLVVLFVIGVFSFRIRADIDNLSVWFVSLAALIVMEAFCIPTDELTGSVPIFVFAAVVAGVALGNLICPVYPDPEADESADEDLFDEAYPGDDSGYARPKRVYAPAPIVTIEDNEEPCEVPANRRRSGRAGRPIENLDEMLPVIEMEEKKEDTDHEIKYLENPLPVPARRRKKAAECDISEPVKDDYDYFVADDDDFDI